MVPPPTQLDAKDYLSSINEIAEMKSCNSCLFFEVRKKKDLYLWMSHTPVGPSVKFYVLNGELVVNGVLTSCAGHTGCAPHICAAMCAGRHALTLCVQCTRWTSFG